MLLIAKLSRIPVSMLYLNAEPLCYCVARSRSYLKFFSISILWPDFHCRGQQPLCVSIPMQMQPPAQPSPLISLTVQSQVQRCLALTLRLKHWLHSLRDTRSGAAISAPSQLQNFLPISAQSLVCSRDVEERCKYAIQ